MNVPKITRWGSIPQEEQVKLQRCKSEIVAELDAVLPTGWSDYIKVNVGRDGVQIKSDRDYYANVKTRIFRSVKPGEVFTLSAKHIEAMTERVEEITIARKRNADRQATANKLRDETEVIRRKYHSERLEIGVDEHGLELRLKPTFDHAYSSARVRLDRKGSISKVTIPGHTAYNTTIDDLQQHIKTWSPVEDEILTIAKTIKAELPESFFLKAEAANG